MWRVAHPPEPWAWVPWQDGPFEGRWDDANGQFRVLYAGRCKLACFLEVTAQFRPDLPLVAEMNAITGDPQDDAYPEPVVGVIPVEWITGRCLGSATVTGSCSTRRRSTDSESADHGRVSLASAHLR